MGNKTLESESHSVEGLGVRLTRQTAEFARLGTSTRTMRIISLDEDMFLHYVSHALIPNAPRLVSHCGFCFLEGQQKIKKPVPEIAFS